MFGALCFIYKMTNRYYYWLLATEPETGKPYLVYGGLTEQEARQKGLEILGGIDFNIKALPTRDKNAASSFIRGKRLEDTHSLKQASVRIGHDRSLKRLRRKQRLNNSW